MITLAIVLLLLAIAAYAYWVFLLTIYPEPIAEDEVHVIGLPDLWKIRVYRRQPAGGEGEPVLLVHGAGANRFDFQFPRGASLVDTLVEAGYDCWMVELRGQRSSEPPFGRSRNDPTMDDYLLIDLPAVVDYIRNHVDYDRIHWIGHSMGGMLFYAFDLTYGGEALRSATTICSPPGFQGTHLRVPRALLALAALPGNLCEVIGRAATPLAARIKLRHYMLPINWANMHPKMGSAEYFNLLSLSSVGVLRDLARYATSRRWVMDRGELDIDAQLDAIETPLLAIYCAGDPLVPSQRAETFFETLQNPDKRMLTLGKRFGHSADYNHIDVVFGRNSEREVFLPIVEWLTAHPIDRYEYDAAAAAATDDLPAQDEPGKSSARRKPPTHRPSTASRPLAKKKPTTRRAPGTRKKKTAETEGSEPSISEPS